MMDKVFSFLYRWVGLFSKQKVNVVIVDNIFTFLNNSLDSISRLLTLAAPITSGFYRLKGKLTENETEFWWKVDFGATIPAESVLINPSSSGFKIVWKVVGGTVEVVEIGSSE